MIGYFEAFVDRDDLCLVIEYADAGDIAGLIDRTRGARGQYLSEEVIWSIMDGILRGLRCLHGLKILHRDIKPANVFLQGGGGGGGRLVPKIGDLNVSKLMKKGVLYTQVGTPYYTSPEQWKDQPYGEKADVWALGCLVYEMMALHPPFRANSLEELGRKVVQGVYPRPPSRYSQALVDAVRRMLTVKPQQRPGVDELLQLPQVSETAGEDYLFGDGGSGGVVMGTLALPSKGDRRQRLPGPFYSTDEKEATPAADEQDLSRTITVERPVVSLVNPPHEAAWLVQQQYQQQQFQQQQQQQQQQQPRMIKIGRRGVLVGGAGPSLQPQQPYLAPPPPQPQPPPQPLPQQPAQPAVWGPPRWVVEEPRPEIKRAAAPAQGRRAAHRHQQPIYSAPSWWG